MQRSKILREFIHSTTPSDKEQHQHETNDIGMSDIVNYFRGMKNSSMNSLATFLEYFFIKFDNLFFLVYSEEK